MDAYKTWLAFLSAEIIERCTARIKEECPGCKEGLLSPILHRHTHFNLLETIRAKMPEISCELDVRKLYNSFLIRFGMFDLSEDELVMLGQSFLRFSTPDAIYFGNYITKDNEKLFYNNLEYEPTPVNATKRRKITIPEDKLNE